MKSAYNYILAFFCSFFLLACSGGGGITDSGDGSTPPTGTTSLVLTIDHSDIDAATPATVTATVSNSLTGALVGELVTFTLNNSQIGSFDPITGTALTGSDGKATITLSTASLAGAGLVTGTIPGGESASVGFTMKGDGGEAGGGAQVSLALTDAAGNAIDAITSLVPGKLTATVTGINKPAIVTFDSSIGDLPIKTAVTDAQGKASIDIYAGNVLGAGEVTASLSSGEIGQTVVVIGATNVLMGSGDPFVKGQAAVSAAVLSAGGTATVSVLIQDEKGNPFTQPVEVNFASTCSGATVPSASLSSPVTSVNGVATSTYLAKGCVGDDPINVSANAGGLSLAAAGTVNVLSADVGSIVFVSASPENISLKGTGGDESSVVLFKVLDTNGNPVSNQAVDFSLNTVVGGISLDPASATTNAQGIVQTVVRTGTVSTSVRVTGTINGSSPVISSQSNELVISTGIPDQDSFSLSAEVVNAEGWDQEGTEVAVTARLADAFNNPVPDGTSVSFTTEGGAIEPSCTTVNGACTVTWRSQQARPEGNTLLDGAGAQTKNPSAQLSYDAALDLYGNLYGQKYGGRATITATAIGEESFPDLNGNGRFDADEMTTFLTEKDVSGNSFDLDDAYNDYNEDGFFNPQQSGGQVGGALEELVDFNANGVFDVKDGKYNGVLCSEPAHAGCADGISESKTLYVRASLVMVMSGSVAFATDADDVRIVDNDGDNLGGSIDILGKGVASVNFTLSDLHNQQMPANSVVKFVASAGSVVSTAEYTWPSSNYNGGREFTVTLKGEEQPNSGTFLVTVTTPGGTITEVLSIPINII
ncbi:Ig-like domain-containing protein [Shewanella sp. AS16]|uniref:Ig-like domain-containing protein n=1 Tax=Shewanella sp. AS16 TaxID=2907625 RepID=UPI001F4398D5|nr:Ig-like domain-containing protein [Shewanella sp. AS16]MCE9687813.1 Ig-like domain-containing protein [Shewanella sp. AS16]